MTQYLGADGFLPMNQEQTIQHKLFEFVPQKEDYLLVNELAWDLVEQRYSFDIGGHHFILPDGVYVFTGCSETFDGDFVRVDEIIGRDVEVLLLNHELKQWKFKPQIFNDVMQDTQFYMPQTKNILPVFANSGWGVLLSYTDQFRNLNLEDGVQLFTV